MITIITTTIITAVIGGIFSFFFTRFNRKLDKIEEHNQQRHEENIATKEADHELLLATAEVTELMARKWNGELVNGELEEAEEELRRARQDLDKLTRKIYYKHLEEL